ncbi:MAG: hypothetical protein LBH48_04720 [Bifidobacteriaceae bacterium]|nr:hypothetical protein [Bifidobacteriaceae bacterium]
MAFDTVGAPLGTFGFWSTTQSNDPMGMWALLEPMRRLPLGDALFSTTFVPGLALLVLIGLPHAAGLVLLLRRRPSAYWVCLAAGLIMVAWISLQLFVLYGPNPMSLIWGAIAVIESALAAAAIRRNRQPAQAR